MTVGVVIVAAVGIGGGIGIALSPSASSAPPPSGSNTMVPYALPTVAKTHAPDSLLFELSDGAKVKAAKSAKASKAAVKSAPRVTLPGKGTPITTTSVPSNSTSGPTDACQAQFSTCVTPVVAQSAVSIMDYNPGADAALTSTSATPRRATPVVVNISNDLQDGTQDWTFNIDGHVGDTSGTTMFDKINYRGDLIASIEFTPFGRDTGLCLQPGTTESKLRACDGAANQEFILTATVPFDNSATHGYYFVLWAPQAVNAQHHLALDAPGHIGGNVTVQRVINVSPGQPSTFMWNAVS